MLVREIKLTQLSSSTIDCSKILMILFLNRTSGAKKFNRIADAGRFVI